jgi:hypothetical protein
MKRIVMLCAASALFLTAAAAYSQSLAELARKEKERRDKIAADSKVITNNDTSKYKAGPITTVTPAAPAAAAQTAAPDKSGMGEAAASKPAKANPDEPTDFQGRPESYWRQTMADARGRVQNLENEANVLILKIADLQNQFYRESNGFKQQEIQRDIQKAIYEQDRNKEDRAKAKDQLQDLEKEARKSGALPGWLTPKSP